MEIVRVMYTFSTAPNRSECNSTKHSGPSGWHLKEFHHSMLWVRFSDLQQQSNNLTSPEKEDISFTVISQQIGY